MPSTHLSPSAQPPFGRYLTFPEREDIVIEVAKDTEGSTGERNALRKLSARRDEAKRFPRPGVEFQRDGVEIGLTVNR